MKIKVNGDFKDVAGSATSVLDLLKICSVAMPDAVSVQLNGIFVDKNDFDSTIVRENDEVDFLYFMGGGL